MPLPLIPIAVTAGLAGLGFLLFGKEEPKKQVQPPTQQLPPQVLPQVITSAPTPQTAPVPIPIPPSPLPVPQIIPQVIPAPAPAPAPAPVIPAQVIPSPVGPIPIPAIPIPAPPPPPPIVPPSPVEPGAGLTATVLGNPGTNLRGSPSTTAPILEGIVNGSKVKVLNPVPLPPTSGAPLGWFNVMSATGKSGFMSAEFLRLDVPGTIPIVPGLLPQPAPAPSPGPAPLPIAPSVAFGNATTTGTPGVNLRSSPSTSGAIIKGLFNGTRVKVLNTKRTPPTTGAPQGWLNVATESGNTGFVSAEFVRPDAGTTFTGERFMMTGREPNLRRRNNINA